MTATLGGCGRETAGLGYNPYRRFKARPVDYAVVVVAILVAVALVAWAALG